MLSSVDSPSPVGDSTAIPPPGKCARTRRAVELSADSYASQGKLIEKPLLTSSKRSAAATNTISSFSEHQSYVSDMVNKYQKERE